MKVHYHEKTTVTLTRPAAVGATPDGDAEPEQQKGRGLKVTAIRLEHPRWVDSFIGHPTEHDPVVRPEIPSHAHIDGDNDRRNYNDCSKPIGELQSL